MPQRAAKQIRKPHTQDIAYLENSGGIDATKQHKVKGEEVAKKQSVDPRKYGPWMRPVWEAGNV